MAEITYIFKVEFLGVWRHLYAGECAVYAYPGDPKGVLRLAFGVPDTFRRGKATCRACGRASSFVHAVPPEADPDRLECGYCGALELAITHWLGEDGEPKSRLEIVR